MLEACRATCACLLGVLVLAACWQQAGASRHDDAAGQLAAAMLHVTRRYLDTTCAQAACNTTLCSGAALSTVLQTDITQAAAAILGMQGCVPEHDQLSVRVQLDAIASAPRITEAVRVFHAEQDVIRITLLPPREPRNVADVAAQWAEAAVPGVDGRWTDFAGRSEADVQAYLDGDNPRIQHLLHYRRDVFQELQLSVPQTWGELLETVAFLNATNYDSKSSEGYAICFNADAHCGAPYILLQIYFSMVVHDGPSASLSGLLDPRTLEPLVNNAAMELALDTFAQLARFNHPLASVGCQAGSQAFCSGHCAITLNADQLRLSNATGCLMEGRLGTAVPPGSAHVLDLRSNTLEECTTTLCPFAVHSQQDATFLVNHAPLNVPLTALYYASHGDSQNAATAIAAFSNHLQHYFAPFDNAVQEALANATGTSQQLAALGLQSPSTGFPGYLPRVPLAASPAAVSVDPLLKLSYNEHDVREFLQVTSEISRFQNRVRGAPAPGASIYRTLLGAAAINATASDANLTLIMDTLDTKFRMVVAAFNDTPLYLKLYRLAVGYTADNAPVAPLPRRGVAWRPAESAGVAVAGAAALVILLVGTLVCIRHRKGKSRRSLLGKLLPPGMGANTTLVVTDIQGSTELWEVLPDEVMDRVLAVHHATLQGLLAEHCGYESATEGDSFILAFHCAADALRYAVAVQKALLAADWPPQLLEQHELAATCKAAPRPTHPDAKLSRVVQSMLLRDELLHHAPATQDGQQQQQQPARLTANFQEAAASGGAACCGACPTWHKLPRQHCAPQRHLPAAVQGCQCVGRRPR